MSKLTSYWTEDFAGSQILVVQKKRGKITITELEEYLRYSPSGMFQGHWAILLNSSDSPCGGSGWMDEIEELGDQVGLYQIEEYEKYPVCRAVTPLLTICPYCGESLKEEKVI